MTPPDPNRLIARFPWGWIATFDDNEIEIVSTIKDPPKVRLAMANGVESNLGAVSANIRRDDGRHEEYGIAMFRMTNQNTEGAFYLALRGPGDQSCKEVLYIGKSGAHFRVPVFAPNLGGAVASAKVALRSHANGKIVCAESSGRDALIANRDAVGAWETFDLIPVP